MYPLARLGFQMWRARAAPPLGLLDPHLSRHVCWPWDLDPWRELNNGRTLTLFDLGRVPAFQRLGMLDTLRAQGWGAAVAGVSVRYRRRVRAFDRLDMVSRLIGWDARFWYVEQSLWRQGDCTTHMLARGAVTGPQGIVAPARVAELLGHTGESPPLPEWVAAWAAADALRPWPPEIAPVL
jgi:acyl-CoA thioesterase FadM